MSEVADGRRIRVALADKDHHTNYFAQPEIAKAIRQTFAF